jgi:hypothetical protein
MRHRDPVTVHAAPGHLMRGIGTAEPEPADSLVRPDYIDILPGHQRCGFIPIRMEQDSVRVVIHGRFTRQLALGVDSHV